MLNVCVEVERPSLTNRENDSVTTSLASSLLMVLAFGVKVYAPVFALTLIWPYVPSRTFDDAMGFVAALIPVDGVLIPYDKNADSSASVA